MIPLTNEEKEIHCTEKNYFFFKKEFNTNNDNKKYHKIRDHCHYTGKCRRFAHDICNLR